MRTALRRARRLGAFLLVTLAAGWVVLRRRSPVAWIEPAPGSPAGSAAAAAPAASAAPAAPATSPAEIGAPGEVPEDVLATDAGLTELPSRTDDEAVPAPSGTVVVDEVLVGELLAEVPADRDVDEAIFEQALVDAQPAAPAVAGDEELVDTDPADPEPSTAEPSTLGTSGTDALPEAVIIEPASADPLIPAPFTPEPEIADPEPVADSSPEPLIVEPVGADPLIPAPFTPEPEISDSDPSADAPTVADFPAPEPDPLASASADAPTVANFPAPGDAVASDAHAEADAGAPTVANFPAPEPGEAEAAGAVAEVVAAEPVEAVVADEPSVAALDEGRTDEELTTPELGIDEPTMTIARDTIAAENEETGTRIAMPTFSEAPTMEIPAVTDDLRAVRGIGPSMERMLHGLGIISFRQLAMLDGVELERVRAELSDFRTRIEREDWVGQARDLHREKYGREPGSTG